MASYLGACLAAMLYINDVIAAEHYTGVAASISWSLTHDRVF